MPVALPASPTSAPVVADEFVAFRTWQPLCLSSSNIVATTTRQPRVLGRTPGTPAPGSCRRHSCASDGRPWRHRTAPGLAGHRTMRLDREAAASDVSRRELVGRVDQRCVDPDRPRAGDPRRPPGAGAPTRVRSATAPEAPLPGGAGTGRHRRRGGQSGDLQVGGLRRFAARTEHALASCSARATSCWPPRRPRPRPTAGPSTPTWPRSRRSSRPVCAGVRAPWGGRPTSTTPASRSSTWTASAESPMGSWSATSGPGRPGRGRPAAGWRAGRPGRRGACGRRGPPSGGSGWSSGSPGPAWSAGRSGPSRPCAWCGPGASRRPPRASGRGRRRSPAARPARWCRRRSARTAACGTSRRSAPPAPP